MHPKSTCCRIKNPTQWKCNEIRNTKSTKSVANVPNNALVVTIVCYVRTFRIGTATCKVLQICDICGIISMLHKSYSSKGWVPVIIFSRYLQIWYIFCVLLCFSLRNDCTLPIGMGSQFPFPSSLTVTLLFPPRQGFAARTFALLVRWNYLIP